MRMRTTAGEDTSVAFGFLKTLLALLEHAPTHFCVAFDPPSASRLVCMRARSPVRC
jgi:5'-3' exonuclease